MLLRLKDGLQGPRQENKLAGRRASVTRKYLSQLRNAAAAQESRLLVLLIPAREDTGDPGVLYQMAVQLMDELNIAYLNPIDILDAVADYALEPDVHWSNSGHQKIGAYLSECVTDFIASGNLADCENVIMP